MDHETVAELLGAFAVDALDSDEAAVVAAHIETCPRCAQEVDEHREAAAALAFAGEQAPEGLWDRINAKLEEEPPALDMARMGPLLRSTKAAEGARSGPRRWAVVAMACTGVAAAIIVAMAIEVGHLRNQVGQLEARSALPAGSLKTVALRSADGQLAVQAVLGPDGSGIVQSGNLPALPDGKTYQLWMIVGGKRISIGVLGTHFDVSPFRATGPMEVLAITAENAPGASTSTEPPVVAGQVPRTA